MIELFVAALLSVSDPAGDAGTDLTAPTATVLRQTDTFDIRSVSVADAPTLNFGVQLERFTRFPGVLLELYLGAMNRDKTAAASGTELLRGSGFGLPGGAGWRYAFRIVGDDVQVFEVQGEGGSPIDITETSGARLSVSGNTLRVETNLPVPKPLSVYAMSGSFDPFSRTGWRAVRDTPSPWGFSGEAAAPVLDVLADTPEAQKRALEQGVLPEVRASANEPGWLALAGAGVAIALAGLAVSLSLGRQTPMLPAPYLAPFTGKDIRRRARLLRNLSRVQGKLALAEEPEVDLEPPPYSEPVLN